MAEEPASPEFLTIARRDGTLTAMSQTTFDALPPNSRVWVFAATRELTEDEAATLHDLADKVMGIWVKKQMEIRGCFEVRDRRFLLVGADESGIHLDGCSVDAMMSWLMRFEAETGLKLVDRTQVYWRDPSGAVRSAPRPEFRKLLAAGEVNERTPVFDTAMSRVETLREGRFELPMEECWHAQLFLQPRAVQS